MKAYYNELDPFAAAWLRELIKAGLIAPGDVDERDIREVRGADLQGYVQHHFFAGIGGWSLALRLAGWPDGRPVWTGSCPCQPFSAAGKGGGARDERHLWPAWFSLIRESKPPVVFGEQVEAAIGHGWWDAVQRDLEGEDYACGMAVLGAHSVGAPHRRQRLYFVGESQVGRWERECLRTAKGRSQDGVAEADACGLVDRPRDGRREECQVGGGVAEGDCEEGRGAGFMSSGAVCGLADSERPSSESGWSAVVTGEGAGAPGAGTHAESGRCGNAGRAVVLPAGEQVGLPGCAWEPGESGELANSRRGIRLKIDSSSRQRESNTKRSGPWSGIKWLPGRDGKLRPAQPSIFPLAHGIPNRVGLLRGAGNAIVPQVAVEFIAAYMEIPTIERQEAIV